MLTEREQRLAVITSRQDPEEGATRVRDLLNMSRPSNPVGVDTVKRALAAAGLHGRKPSLKPWIKKKNKAARLKFVNFLSRLTLAKQRSNTGITVDENDTDA